MNFEFARQINPFLETLNFVKALDIAEASLKKLPATDFHAILGRPIVNQAEDLAAWIDRFYKTVAKKINIKALYFELNEFDINFKTWKIDGFAYDIDGGLDLNDMEWLSDFTKEKTTAKGFILTGYEKLQRAFEKVAITNGNLQDAKDWCEQLIIARFMELMRAAHVKAIEKNLDWCKIPIYFTEHSYDFIVRSVN
jgi:hypothetical protein